MGHPPHIALASAWSAAIDEHADAWWSYALHLARRHDDAEDLVQTMLSKMIERGIGPTDVAPGYPFRVMRHAWISRERKRRTRREHAPRLVRAEAPPLQSDERLDDALAALSDEQREVVLLKHRAGLTLEQIALATDRPLGTVAGQHRRALGALRARLSPHEEARP